jgi:kynurenine formamidase
MTPPVPFDELASRVRNWGRWGEEDQRGTLNFITPEVVAAAAATVKSGETISLAIPFDETGPQDGRIRGNPVRLMKQTGHHSQGYPGRFRYSDDFVFMALQAASQWDALAHVHYGGFMYNGFSTENIDEYGTRKCDVTQLNPGVVSRGVLIDVARYRGVPWLPVGEAISPTELDEILQSQGVELHSGDVLLIRTGWRARYLSDLDKAAFKAGEPGLSVACVEWLHHHEVAAVGSDNFAVEVLPGEYSDEYLPFHMIAIRDMGMPLAEILDLEALSQACFADGRYEFLFTGAPLPFTGGVGSPVNPLAIR